MGEKSGEEEGVEVERGEDSGVGKTKVGEENFGYGPLFTRIFYLFIITSFNLA